MGKEIKIQIKPQESITCENGKIEIELLDVLSDIETRLSEIDELLFEREQNINKLTNQGDSVDNITALICGLVSGIIDVAFIREWDFSKAKAWSNKEISERVVAFAQRDPEYQKIMAERGDVNQENRLFHALKFLEKKYKLPGDGDWQYEGSSITAKSHHLDDFCHHPTIIGLVCCVIVQFTQKSIYNDAQGNNIQIPVTVNQYNQFVGRNIAGKIFSGIVNWFINVAETINNRKGHLISDMAGSKSSAKKGNNGIGIPGTFLSLAKELSALPCFKNKEFSNNLRKAFENGIGDKKGQVDLGILNTLFEGASSNFDMRTEMAIGHELKRQSIVVTINEILVRASYFIKSLVTELKIHKTLGSVDWNKVIPFNNRTVERMITISTGTFFAVDVFDALIEGAINAKGSWIEFGRQVVLRLNFADIGRFTIALGNEIRMGLQYQQEYRQQMLLKNEELYLLNAKIYYGDVLLWEAVKNAEESVDSLCITIQKCLPQIIQDLEESKKSVLQIKKIDIAKIRNNNNGLSEDILDIL